MEDRRRNTYIGLAIIALVALAIVALPSGDDFTRFISEALQAAFLAAIAVSVARLYRSQSMWLNSLPDRDRGILYGAGAIATLTVVADARWREIGNGGRVAQWCIIGGCLFAAYWVWRESRRYSY